jgi:hypothetical protein
MRRYDLEDGRVLCTLVELDMWSISIDGDSKSQVLGTPLIGVLMEVLGLNPAHDEPTAAVESLAARIRRDYSEAGNTIPQ